MRNAHAALLAVVVAACIAALAAAVLLWPPRVAVPEDDGSVTLVDGTLTAIEQVAEDDTAGLTPGALALTITAELADGREITFDMVDETGDTFAVGQRVRVAEAEAPDGGVTWYINDVKRDVPLLALTALFLVAVLAFGRWQGVRALIGLGLTLAVVVVFIVPAMLAGRDPVIVALAAAVAIMVATLYLTHGVRPKTTAAVVGTLVALGLTVALSWVFIEVTALTGLADEEARLASVQVGGLSLRGLLLAGIIIGALGVLDDVTMAQSSTVFELRRADPLASAGRLFSGAMTVGRDHVAATINTLFLAYAGASLPLLILFSTSPDPLPVIMSSEIVAVEIVRTLVGSIGLMASVPVTTALAAWLARGPAVADQPGARHDADAALPDPAATVPALGDPGADPGPGGGRTADADADAVGRGIQGADAGAVGRGIQGADAGAVGRGIQGADAGAVGRGIQGADAGAVGRRIRGADADAVGRGTPDPHPAERDPDDRRPPGRQPAAPSVRDPADDEELEWERRLRESYGLHRRPDPQPVRDEEQR